MSKLIRKKLCSKILQIIKNVLHLSSGPPEINNNNRISKRNYKLNLQTNKPIAILHK